MSRTIISRKSGLAAVALTVAAATGVAVPAANAAAVPNHTTTRDSATVRFTHAQQSEWAKLTNTPAKRAAVARTLQSAFGSVSAAKSGAPIGVRAAQPRLSYGYNGHVWIILSYADAARGLIKVGVAYCKTRLPGFVCDAVGWVLDRLVAGWGWSSSHGVWGAAYWSGYVTGGRW